MFSNKLTRKAALLLIGCLLATCNQFQAQTSRRLKGVGRTFASGGGGHTFSVVQQGGCYQNSSSTTMPCTMTATGAGHGLFFWCAYGTSLSISGATALNTAAAPNTGNNAAFIIPSVTTGTTSVTATVTAYAASGCLFWEIAGTVTSSPLDTASSITKSAYGTGGLTSIAGSVSTTNANDVIIGCANPTSAGNPFTPGTGYTDGGYYSGSSGVTIDCVWQKVASTGSYNPGVEWTGSQYSTVGTVALKLQ